jgi:puromycin-sensitive aminopeptidase
VTSAPTDQGYRLPRSALPRRYAIRIAPDLEARTFEGEVSIELDLHEPVDEIVLNAAELVVEAASLTEQGGGGWPLRVELDEEAERARFALGSEVGPGRYVLSCRFSGRLGSRLRGFYTSTFADGDGNERVIASTHFEATDARRAFPCFDEPDMKAVFSVTLDVPDGLFAVSNSPEAEVTELGGGVRRIRFSDTMRMSTYLVAYAVGPFEATEPVVANGVPVRVVAPVGKLHLSAFALEAASHCLAFFHDYFAIPYPAEKLDLVAIPDFAMGAMENLGCVTFREQALLCDPVQSSIPELARIAEVVEHELAHMWFGDLVTMKWWNGIWLNEAFATFMSLVCLDDFRPEWRPWVSFGVETDAALQVDGLHSTRPIEYEVRTPDEADAMFDSLTYEKGGSVLRMVEQYLGPERFRDGVRHYLRKHAYGNTETTDLWDAIEEVAGGEPVRAMLDGWVFQGGHPLVTARAVDGRVVASAQPFEYLPRFELPERAGPSSIGSGWLVPLLVAARPGPAEPHLLGPAPSGRDPLDCGPAEGLVVANAGGSGAFRLRYEGELLDRILGNLGELEPLERFRLVADTWACTLARLGSLDDYLAVLGQLRAEPDPNVWQVVAGSLALLDYVAAGVAEAELERATRELAGERLRRLGFAVSAEDSPEDERSRSLLIDLLGTIGADADVRAAAQDAFARARSAPEREGLSASVEEAVLKVVVATGSAEELELVRAGYRHPVDPVSERRHLTALAAARAPALVDEVLSMVLGEVRTQDGAYVLRQLLVNRHAGQRAWRFVVDHFDELSEHLPHRAMPSVLGGVARLVQPEPEPGVPGSPGGMQLVEMVQELVAGRDFGGHQKTIDQALERQLVNARFVAEHRATIAGVLAKV